jgi:hypothetical protein
MYVNCILLSQRSFVSCLDYVSLTDKVIMNDEFVVVVKYFKVPFQDVASGMRKAKNFPWS